MGGIGKDGTGHSTQMRKCMKNFNFKLDIDEIDRIIEEDDSLQVDENQNSNSKKSNLDSEINQEVKVDIQPDVINGEA